VPNHRLNCLRFSVLSRCGRAGGRCVKVPSLGDETRPPFCTVVLWSATGYRSFSRPPPPLRCVTKSTKSTHAHWVVRKWEPFRNDIARRLKLNFFILAVCAPRLETGWKKIASQCEHTSPQAGIGNRKKTYWRLLTGRQNFSVCYLHYSYTAFWSGNTFWDKQRTLHVHALLSKTVLDKSVVYCTYRLNYIVIYLLPFSLITVT
jgi:hypothetical protein